MTTYNIWNKWDKLNTVMLGDHYRPEFFNGIKNQKIQSALKKISEETLEDLNYYETVLKDFGCKVLRPEIDESDNILNYLENKSLNYIPRSPLQPRDFQLVIGDKLFYTGRDHSGVKKTLDKYNNDCYVVKVPIENEIYNIIACHESGDWPSYELYQKNYLDKSYFKQHVWDELNFMASAETCADFPISAPSITVVGKDIYLDLKSTNENVNSTEQINLFKQLFSNFRFNLLSIGGHNDGCFHTLKPGVILSLEEIQFYNKTFPNWDVCYLPDQSWDKVKGFLKLKDQVKGKWWIPGEEENTDLTHFVETWLNDWVGYVEETVFDVNVLVLDEHHVCVSNMNPTVVGFLKKHNMEAIHVPWRHRYFWDGGLHCITLDLHRTGVQQDYFPDREKQIICKGF